jgi:predicted regulator of Ras-like GTPase activity (Roadblock/LC7/MglB family)
MSKIPDSQKDFIERVEDLLDKAIHEKLAIKALSVGTHGGNIIASCIKPDIKKYNAKEMVAATTSILFISSKAASKIAEDNLKHVITYGPTYILVCFLTRNISFGAILDRQVVELEGIDQYVSDLNELALKISAIIETSDINYGDIFSRIKVAIPDANMYAIVTKDGLPIKIQSDNVDEARLSAFISAIHSVNNLITGEDAEFTTVIGESQSIIIHVLDETRLLAISIPAGISSNLMRYVVRIKELIKI